MNGAIIPVDIHQEDIQTEYSCYREGNIVIIWLRGLHITNGAVPSGFSIGSDYRPKEVLYAPVVVVKSGTSRSVGYAELNTSGQLTPIDIVSGAYVLNFTGTLYGEFVFKV